ncbi:nitrate ABC transporter substrate-binding protein [Xylanimonas ulmi]|uniref:ABC-type nitrate/sulfonate/bicarbonate transport system substrate-binding protein n=2 Tax=Xylanimonas ulmi TaxID=228973 RepID=A0A4Q7M429_9MICO|nr:hypothetical protein EV386_1007 [Xylanibacterium ulmi]
MHHKSRRAVVLGAVALTASLAACSAGEEAAQPAKPASTAAARYATPLADVCPSTVSLQLPWWPQSEYGWAYQLIGPGGVADPETYRYTGPLGNTGVDLEIRSGGPALGGELPLATLYKDDDVLLGQTTTEDSIAGAAEHPSVSVFTFEQKSPLVFFWGADDWDFQTISDIRDAGVTLQAFEGATYLDVLTAKGLLEPGQIDGGYDGTPARFVAEDGRIVSQGIITSEVYSYEHDIPAWDKPVKYVKVGDEYEAYHSEVAIRSDKLDENRACLEKLVPLLQQAAVDYWTDPASTNQVLLDVVDAFEGAWQLSAGLNDFAVEVALKEGIVANGPDHVFGSHDPARLDRFIADVSPALARQGIAVKEGLTSSDIATNEFLDPSIALPEQP